MVSIDIICPLYNAGKYIENLHKSFLRQKNVNLNDIHYILTESKDNTENYLKTNNLHYDVIKKEDFSHSTVREKAAFESEAGIVVFVTQDVDIRNDDWLEKLVTPIINGEADACYSRQLTKYNNIEKYTRESNYPEKSFIRSKKDIEEWGLKTFFFSDASSAINRNVFVKLNGYDQKRLPISEDMYIAYKLIMSGYTIKYCADSIVYHSHNFSFGELYERYKLTGKFFKENSYLDNYGTNKSGGGLAKYVLKRAIQDKNIKVIFRWLPDMTARYLGMKLGKKNIRKSINS